MDFKKASIINSVLRIFLTKRNEKDYLIAFGRPEMLRNTGE
jgi:hypothetical protein